MLGYDKLDEFHLEIIKELKEVENSQDKKGLFLLPRGHYKSTLITIAWTIQQLINNPNVSIFIANATLSNAQMFLREIRGHLEKNEKLKELFGSSVSEKWNDSEIVINQRTKNQKESSVKIGSPDHTSVGAHYDIIILDDIVSPENINTKEQSDKIIQFYKNCQDLGKPDKTVFIIIGTRYSYFDTYNHLISSLQVGRDILNNQLVTKELIKQYA